MIYTVELPVSEHIRPEVLEAQVKKVKNLKDYNIFEAVADDG